MTSLLSGTQVRAVIAYVTDYITKFKLSTDAFFDTIRSVLDKNTELLELANHNRNESARRLIVKVVNALSASAEIGGPAVCAA